MAEYLIRDAEGRFLSGPRQWSDAWSDARTFEVKATAIAAARRSGVLCEVVQDFGLETQQVIETVG